MADLLTLEQWEWRYKDMAYKSHADAMERFWCEQVIWSWQTFGSPDSRGPRGSLLHLRKEIDEVLACPEDLEEWADLFILAIDAAWRRGITWGILLDQMRLKLAKNKAREWPTPTTDRPVEHVKVYQAANLPLPQGWRWLVGEGWRKMAAGLSFPNAIVTPELGLALASFERPFEGYPLMFGFDVEDQAVGALERAQAVLRATS